jgi:hypothetical protein
MTKQQQQQQQEGSNRPGMAAHTALLLVFANKQGLQNVMNAAEITD